ncbi:MAG: ABC transporter ATP-binding protein [Ruminococcaceae bacterium]|nr:ABC transporter ATP-binding protein [Oscillospiraceae bacterium]
MKAIDVKNLNFKYPACQDHVLQNVNLRVESGDFIAVVGNNGCGKSTLCKALNGLIPKSIAGQFEGQVVINGQDIKDLTVGQVARKVGYVYQDFENQIVRPKVLDDASYACLNYGMPDYIKKGEDALKQVKLYDKRDENVWVLSGGQTHLLALAGALSLAPDILILDEPIAQLDPERADIIYEILRELNQNQNKTIIVIEHSTEYIAEYCNRVVLMKDGQILWDKETKEALQMVDVLMDSDIFPPQVTRAAKKSMGRDDLRPGLLPVNLDEGYEVFKDFTYRPKENPPPEINDGDNVISISGVTMAYKTIYDEPNVIFSNLNLDIKNGEKIALIGSNGSGKSTLLKMLVGLVKPLKGKILIDNKDIRKMKIDRLARVISLVYQNPEQMFIMDNIEHDISYSSKARNIENWEEKLEILLERFDLLDLRKRDGRLLSGGQMRRASLAIGTALDPKVLLLDEPTSNLDIRTRKEVMALLNEMKAMTETVIIATHDMQLVCEWAERIIVLHEGQIEADGRRDEIFADREILERVGIRPPQIFHLAKKINPDALVYTIDDFLEDFEVNRD